jgi:hypothetical protein
MISAVLSLEPADLGEGAFAEGAGGKGLDPAAGGFGVASCPLVDDRDDSFLLA